MESKTLVNFVPPIARGLNLLVLHNTSYHSYLSSLFGQFSFNVTAVSDPYKAAHMIRNNEGYYKIVIAQVNMPGFNAVSFMNFLSQKNIQLIFVCPKEIDDTTWQLLAQGSSYFIEEPVVTRDVKFLWHHLYKTKSGLVKEPAHGNAYYCGKKGCKAYAGRKGDGNKQVPILMKFDNKNYTAVEGEVKREHQIEPVKRKRMVWTRDLHELFEKVCKMLGDKAYPGEILHAMNLPESVVNISQVRSHLQVYKDHLKLKETDSSDLSSASARLTPYGRGRGRGRGRKRSGVFGSPSNPGLAPSNPAPTSLLNMNQKQNLYQMNPAISAQTQVSGTSKLAGIQGKTSFGHIFRPGVANNESQGLASVMGNPVPEAPTVENQPEEDLETVLRRMRDDKHFADEMGLGYEYEHNEMLREYLGNNGQFPGV